MTALGFFWKAGWAFVLGYAVSAMIQTFVPKRRLTRHMGAPSLKSLSLATAFGAISSSCSFAALSAARSLVLKAAHFVAAVAFMFASTNLVIELGILIAIFLGWQYLAAELMGGVVLIAISAVLIRYTYPSTWLQTAREKVENEAESEHENFNPWRRVRSMHGWRMVGHRFVMEWKMVWHEILAGFTIAGFVKVLVPDRIWQAIFLTNVPDDAVPSFWIVLENAIVGPFVAAATFIGSMGNIPLATVLAGSGTAFAGVMAFIYSDLMVPPIVRVNARYYGWQVALCIAAVMFASIVCTALLLHYGFAATGLTPETTAVSVDSARAFDVDYTLWLNLAFAAIAGVMIVLHRQYASSHEPKAHKPRRGTIQMTVSITAIAVLVTGLIASAAIA
ncbi:MAG: permease [Phycisphaerae bacterium]|nr:permease [Phycisphaerae bacterium]